MTYYLYHIPGKKIGVTRDLYKRVTLTQGYKPGEYEVLESSTDIDYISEKEIELQQSYGYRKDHKLYKNLFNMKLNVTEQTTTFPVPLTQLKDRLHNQIGLKWKTEFGKIHLCPQLANWIVVNAHTSMYNSERSYVYNKALWEAFAEINSLESLEQQFKPGTTEKVDPDLIPLAPKNAQFDLIRNWAAERGIYEKGNSHTQYVKLQEEAGELAKALLKNDRPEIVDGIGDMIVVLTNLAYIEGLFIEDCIESAYSEILNRKGKMINGTFVKEDLNNITVKDEKIL
jgi:NTP pyrophosphatase (non-canonical NTP hydrolase)|tara:strand:- start:999 stop:1853 length:855 start_codon:yes stop_codon:yes gene_type:complete